jgi:hypothetical protein
MLKGKINAKREELRQKRHDRSLKKCPKREKISFSERGEGNKSRFQTKI